MGTPQGVRHEGARPPPEQPGFFLTCCYIILYVYNAPAASLAIDVKQRK